MGVSARRAAAAALAALSIALLAAGCSAGGAGSGSTRAASPGAGTSRQPSGDRSGSSEQGCGGLGPFDPICGERFRSVAAMDGASEAAWFSAGTTVTIEIQRQGGAAVLDLDADTIIVDAPISWSDDRLTTDMAAAMTSQNAVEPSGPSAYTWMRQFLAQPLTFALSDDHETLTFSCGTQRAVFSAE